VLNKELKAYMNHVAQILLEIDQAKKALEELQRRLVKVNEIYLKELNK
jgi:hypothetical protein